MGLEHLISVVILLRKSKVSQLDLRMLDVLVIAEEDVRQLQIAMHYLYIPERTQSLA